MWTILEAKSLDKTVKQLPVEILKRYEKWKDIVRISGLQGLKEVKGFHDEKLKGVRLGCRSSRLGDKYRVIYSADGKRLLVKVIALTPHDYRRLK